MGARTSAARAEVVAARDGLGEETVRLEAAGRAAVDIPARIRREPVKVAGAASGAAFLLLGGPGRLIRGVRRAVFGPDADLPRSMLPKEVDKTIRKLGSDGDKVRGTLEREFASYLDEKAPRRRERDLGLIAGGLLSNLLRPVTIRAGRELVERLFNPDGTTFGEALGRARARQAAQRRATAGEASDAGARDVEGREARGRYPGPSATSGNDRGPSSR